MTDAKWPKKYTPERLAEVLPHVAKSKYSTQNKGTGPERRKLVDTVARSTVPVEHLLGVQFNPGQISLGSIDNAKGGGSLQTAGNYYRVGSKRGESVAHAPTVNILRGESEGSTPIHEIGHHHSVLAGTHHNDYNSASKRGAEEAYADDYASKHYRNEKGQPEQQHLYARGLRSASRTDEFYNSYHGHRQTPIGGLDWDTAIKQEDDFHEANPVLPGFPKRLGPVS